MTFSKFSSLEAIQIRFTCEDFIQAMQIYKLGNEIGFDGLDDDDFSFMLAVLYDLNSGLQLCINDLLKL